MEKQDSALKDESLPSEQKATDFPEDDHEDEEDDHEDEDTDGNEPKLPDPLPPPPENKDEKGAKGRHESFVDFYQNALYFLLSLFNFFDLYLFRT